MVQWPGCRPMSQKFAFYFWMCQKAFPIIISIYICLFFSHSLLSYIWKLTRKTRNYFREGVTMHFGLYADTWRKLHKLPQCFQILKYYSFLNPVHSTISTQNNSISEGNRHPTHWLEINVYEDI